MKNNLSENENKVLEHLKKHKELTTRQAVIELDINSVADVIMRLRDYGYDIPDIEWRKNLETNKRYGVYKML
jgi:hypothetical protein